MYDADGKSSADIAVLMHEIGHALKLKHPYEEGYGNQTNYPSVMQAKLNAGYTGYITTVDKGSLIKKRGE